MKKINAHLIFMALGLMTLFAFHKKYSTETFIFFGFAENKEMEIRLEHPVTIQQVFVTPGKKVKKGELLLATKRSGMALTQSDLHHDIARLDSQHKIRESQLRGSINSLLAQKAAKVSELTSQIDQLESELSINQTLIDGLESIKTPREKDPRSPAKLKIEGLKNELKLAVKPLDAEIKKLHQELFASKNPIEIQIQQLKDELGFVHQDEEQLNIYAHTDGVVGNVFCKAGEQVAPFTTLLIFYEVNPTEVMAYVLESLLLNVQLGDSVLVQSSTRLDAHCLGEVIGMGSRIVEIPERLRKIPAFKLYGREVQIKIPHTNDFLQKEKVTIKSYRESGMGKDRHTLQARVGLAE